MEKIIKKPDWFKVKYNKEAVDKMQEMLSRLSLNTVCKEANCPNLGECYKKKTATFMILGSKCTRNCRFCNVSKGEPQKLDPHEHQKVAQAVKELNLKHVVITCVTRDDLVDYGANHFAKTIKEIKKVAKDTSIEVLISDFGGKQKNLDIVIKESPAVINHNIETVPELYEKVRPQADYQRSLGVLEYVKDKAPHIITKTGIMVGLGETDDAVYRAMDDALRAGCDIFTIGQYMRPSPEHIEIKKYVTPEKFMEYYKVGVEKGFKYIASGPLVRSSYRAGEAIKK